MLVPTAATISARAANASCRWCIWSAQLSLLYAQSLGRCRQAGKRKEEEKERARSFSFLIDRVKLTLVRNAKKWWSFKVMFFQYGNGGTVVGGGVEREGLWQLPQDSPVIPNSASLVPTCTRTWQHESPAGNRLTLRVRGTTACFFLSIPLGLILPHPTHERSSEDHLSLPGAVVPSGSYTWADPPEWGS